MEPPQASEVRVRLLFASLCHSDVTIRHGFPLVSIYIYIYILVILICMDDKVNGRVIFFSSMISFGIIVYFVIVGLSSYEF